MHCDQVLSTEFPLDEIVIVKNGCSSALVCSSGKDLFIYNIEGPETSLENWKNARLCQCFNLDSFVVKILPYEKKLFIVLEDGFLCRLESVDSCQDDEYDMFEIEESPDTISSWKLENVCSLPDSSVVSASVSKLGVCVLTKSDDKLQLFVVKRKPVLCFTFNKSRSSLGCCCVLNISNLSFDFMNLWFPHVERSEEFLLVGLSDGTLYCFPLTLPLKSYIIYNSVHSIINISWFQNRQSERFDALVIVLDSGAVVRLTPIGEEVSFPFLPFLNSSISLKNCIISKGELETRYLLLSDQSNESKLFSVGEVTSACNCNDNNKLILVCDNQCKVYLLFEDKSEARKESVKIKKDLSGLPKINDLQKLIAKSQQLSKINKTIKIHDEYLRAKSLVSRSDVLKRHFSLSLKLVQILEDNHTVRLKLSFDLPGIVFSKDFWKVKVSLTTVSSSSCFVKDLVHNISSERYLIQLITIPIMFELLYDMDFKLVSYVESKNVELNLPLGVVELDASCFLLPPSLRELSQWNRDPSESLWVNCNTKYSVSVNIPEVPSNYQDLITKLLNNSKALWRTSEWKKMLQNHCVSCVLFGTELNFTISENHIGIESFNLKACQAVRLAFYKILNKDISLSWRDTLAHSLMGWQQAENVIEMSLAPEGHINDLYNILKNSDL